MVSGAISDSDTYVGGTWFVRFRSVVRTASVRGSSVVRTASVRGSYGFGPWFVRGRYDFGSYFDLTRSTDHPPLAVTDLGQKGMERM